MNEDLTSLLNIISKINEKYEEIYKISGEKFNIFEILKVTNTEKYHSRVLATLLDPKGSHGKGDLFLEKFLEIVATKRETDAKTDEDSKDVVGKKFSIEGVRVQEEKPIDNGRPDITITNKNGKIILENKIWAEEGYYQLFTYSKEKPTHLIYLTLYGQEVKHKENFYYIKMSYRKDILTWLELCKKESVDNPILRETLTQYILLIKQLTGQPRSRDMEKEVFDAIIKDSKYISAAFDIAGSFEAVKKRIVEEKFLTPLKEVAKLEEFEELDIDIHGQESYFKGWNTFDIGLKRERWNYLRIALKSIGQGKGFLYGLLSNEGVELEKSKLVNHMSKIEEEVKEEAKKSSYDGCCYNNKNEHWFLLYRYKNNSLWENWADTKDFFTKIFSENGIEGMNSEFKRVIKELSKIGDRLEAKLKEM